MYQYLKGTTGIRGNMFQLPKKAILTDSLHSMLLDEGQVHSTHDDTEICLLFAKYSFTNQEIALSIVMNPAKTECFHTCLSLIS